MVMSCTCDHKAQDEIHGKGKRVFNPTQKGKTGAVVWRCTVCTKEKNELK